MFHLRHLNRFHKPILRTLKTHSTVFNKTYTETYEWLLKENENYKIGLSKYAIEELGDLVYIEFPLENGDIVNKGEELVIVESVKATATINAPFDCVVIENNNDLEENIDVINEDSECENSSWFLKIKEN